MSEPQKFHVVGDWTPDGLKRLKEGGATHVHHVMPGESSMYLKVTGLALFAATNPYQLPGDDVPSFSLDPRLSAGRSLFYANVIGRNKLTEIDWAYRIEAWDADATQFVESIVAPSSVSSRVITFVYVDQPPPLKSCLEESETHPGWGELTTSDLRAVLTDERHILGGPWGTGDFAWIASLELPVNGIAIACYDSRLPPERRELSRVWGSALPLMDVETCVALLQEAHRVFGN